MQAKLKVSRYDPETMGQGQQRWDEFELDVHPNATVLDALIQIREEVDGTLALRCACRASICGSCGMRVNGDAKLVCKSRIADVAEEGATIVVEPMGNQAVIKDLVVTLDTFFDKVRQVDPYLQPDTVPEQGEYVASDESMVNLLTAMNCIMCGACVSDCTVLEVDEAFIGPAALAKAWRFVEDPRDDQRDARLGRAQRCRRRHLGLHTLLQVRRSLPERRCAHGPHHGDARHGDRSRQHQHIRLSTHRILQQIGQETRPTRRSATWRSNQPVTPTFHA